MILQMQWKLPAPAERYYRLTGGSPIELYVETAAGDFPCHG